jgi:hypothetical protein
MTMAEIRELTDAEIRQKMPLFESSVAPIAVVANKPSVMPGGGGKQAVSYMATDTTGTVSMLPLTGGRP